MPVVREGRDGGRVGRLVQVIRRDRGKWGKTGVDSEGGMKGKAIRLVKMVRREVAKTGLDHKLHRSSWYSY